MIDRQRRFRGAIAASIVLAVAGLLDRSGALLLAAVVPLAYVACGSLSRAPTPELAAERRIEPTPAPPDRPVRVTLTVRNDDDRTVPDVRVVDGVPDALAVFEGTPRGGATLAPGEELTVRYLVGAKRGDHEFAPPEVRVRGLGAGGRATRRLPVGGDSRLVCRLDADAPPVAEQGSGRAGLLATDDPGQGVTFHSTRKYHPTDPADRIDWRGYAKRGELATTNYERTVAGTVVLVVDARASARVVAGPGRPTAVEIAAYAMTHAVSDLLGRGHEVGVAVLGVDGAGPGGLAWLPPGGGREQRSRALELFRLATDAEGRSVHAPADQVRELLGLLSPDAQLVFGSPLLDDGAVEAVRTWRAAGVPVTVLSPDVVPENTVGGQYTQVRRRTRLVDCGTAGARTIDWRRGTPLPVVLAEAFEADARVPESRRLGRAGGRG